MKGKNEIVRLQNIIENDRLNNSQDFEKIITHDLATLLKEYFDFRGEPELKIEKYNDKYMININLIISRIRGFGVLPKDN